MAYFGSNCIKYGQVQGTVESKRILMIATKKGLSTLGIDAAWTSKELSAIAQIEERSSPRLTMVARSFSEVEPISWDIPCIRTILPIRTAIGQLSLADAVAVDMPLARHPILGRRPSDDAISTHYGGRWASTHTPNKERPGKLSQEMFDALNRSGYRFVTKGSSDGGRIFLETYPHPVIIEMMRLDRRLPYKVAKRSKYWPGLTAGERTDRCAQELDRLRGALATRISGVESLVPSAVKILGKSRNYGGMVLKGIEDVLDAVVCAYVALQFLKGKIKGFGDRDSTIWIPAER